MKKCKPLQSCLGLILYPGMEILLQKEAGSVLTGCQGTDKYCKQPAQQEAFAFDKRKAVFLAEGWGVIIMGI